MTIKLKAVKCSSSLKNIWLKYEQAQLSHFTVIGTQLDPLEVNTSARLQSLHTLWSVGIKVKRQRLISHDQEVSIVLDNAVIGPRVRTQVSRHKNLLCICSHITLMAKHAVAQTRGTKEPPQKQLDIIVIKILILLMHT